MAEDPAAELVVTAGLDAGRRVVLRPGERATLGRDADATLRIVDDRASRQHVLVELGPDGLWVSDVGSRNGTLLGGQPLVAHQRVRVADRAALTIGAHTIEVALRRPAGPPPPPGGWPPGLLEHYQVARLLGGGAAGMVYAAAHRASGRPVALKLLAPTAADPDLPARFAREAQVRVRHPHVVEVLELRMDGGRACIVMELVEGRSLDQPLREGAIAIPLALRIGADAAEGLAAAHAAGVVHRDIKPANIIVDRHQRAKVGDFGLAKVLGSALTVTGTGLGTLDYVSPEQALDAKRADAKSDLYSLGATLYHAIAGRPALDSRQPDFFDRLTTETPPSLARVRPDCPRPVAAAIAALLEKHPDDRPAGAAEVSATLRRLAGS